MKTKIFTLLLAVAASVGIMNATITVRLDPTSCSDWSEVGLYAWTDEGTAVLGSFPGTPVSIDDSGWYSFTFASNDKINIIWNDGKDHSGNGFGVQTVDINHVTESTCYALDTIDSRGNITVDVVDCPTGGTSDPAPSPVSGKFQICDLYYILNGRTKTAEVISKLEGHYSGSIVIPESVEYNAVTYSVTSIKNLTFRNCTGLKSIEIPNSITSIGDFAFECCTGLTSVTIPNSVTNIGKSAFKSCTNLTAVTLISNAVASGTYSASNNLTSIFGSNVTQYIFGEGVTAIGDYALYNATKLQTVAIPSSTVSVGDQSFTNCSQLTTININSNAIVGKTYTATDNLATIFGSQVQTYNLGDAIASIGDNAFFNCSNVTSLNIPDGVTTIGNNSFAGCSGVTSFVIPQSVTSIGEKAFRASVGVETLILPNVTTIGNAAFGDCTNLSTLQLGNGLLSIGDSAFSSCYNLAAVEFPSSLQTIGNAAFFQCNRITNAIILENAIFLGQSAFKACTGLLSVVIPENITNIEENTFYGCTALASVNLPHTLTTIKDNAFANCSSLQLDSLPAALTSLGANAFSGCSSLASITLPASLKTIAKNAFNECSGIAEVKIDDLLAWCKIDFANSKSNPLLYARNLYLGDSLVTKLEIPNKVTELKPWAFVNCSSIQSVVIPNTVSTFSPNTFPGCENITSVEWHAKNIVDYESSAASPFYDSRNKITAFVFGEETEHVPAYICTGMKGINSLALPSYLKSIGDYAFKGLSKIKQINVPNEVTAIGAHAFDSCILVNTIYLGYQVEEIGDYAFKGCIRVNDITSMNTTTPVVYENTLSSISDYAYLYVPAGSKRTYQLDPYWGRFDIREIASEETTLTKNSVSVEANDDNAIFIWPTDSAAASYSLQITKDDVVFCTLIFNSNGQLTGISFAPSRNGTQHAPAATKSVAGMSFTITGLNVASKYAYHLVVKDEEQKDVQSYSGEFATTGYTGEVNPGGEPEITPAGFEDIQTDNEKVSKYMINGQVLILRGDKTYTITGQEVK